MNTKSETFGQFVNQRRIEQGITLRRFADKIGITPSFLSDIENDRRMPLTDYDKLITICELLKLNTQDQQYMFDLIASARNITAPDIDQYLKDNPIIVYALRSAKEKKLVESEWQAMIDELIQRKE